MIQLLAFIKEADDLRLRHIDDAVEYFRQFYDDKRIKGFKVEKGNTVIANPAASNYMLCCIL